LYAFSILKNNLTFMIEIDEITLMIAPAYEVVRSVRCYDEYS